MTVWAVGTDTSAHDAHLPFIAYGSDHDNRSRIQYSHRQPF